MKIPNYRRLVEQQGTPFTQEEVTAAPCFVRCIRDATFKPGPVANSPYLVCMSTEFMADTQKRFLYKIDGLAGGVKTTKMIPALNFCRWYPKVGDLVFILEEADPLLVTKVDTDRTSGRPTFMTHRYHNIAHEWRFYQKFVEPDISPAIGIVLDKDVAQAFAQLLDPSSATVTDSSFVNNGTAAAALAAAATPAPSPVPSPVQVPVTDNAAHQVRLQHLRKLYDNSLRSAMAYASQYQKQANEALPGQEALQVLVASLPPVIAMPVSAE